jgi:hypothetical protein
VRKPIFGIEFRNLLLVYTNDEKWMKWENSQWHELDIAALPQPEPVKKERAAPAHEADIGEQEWDTFWSAYGHKVAKQNAEKAWRKLSFGDKQRAILAVASYVERTTTDPHDGTRRPLRAHAATWLNSKRWEDEANTEWQSEHQQDDVL